MRRSILLLVSILIGVVIYTLVWHAPLFQSSGLSGSGILDKIHGLFSHVRHSVLNAGPAGILAFVLLYVICPLFMLPVLPLTLLAGLVFGYWGFPLVVFSALLSAITGFIVARYFLHRPIAAVTKNKVLFRAVKRAVNSGGWKMVTMVRLSPVINFSIQNYLLGITDIRLIPYLIGTTLGVTPISCFYVYMGSLGYLDNGNPWQWGVIAAGVIATALVIRSLSKKTRLALRQIESEYLEQPVTSR